MKRVFLGASICATILLASTPLDRAIDEFNKKEFESSYTQLKEILRDDFSNSEANLYFGLSAYELGNYDEALATFERILISNPNNLRAKLELGRVYLALGDLSRALVEFDDVLAQNPPESVRSNIETLKNELYKQQRKYTIRNRLFLGAMYESNVNSNPGYENIESYFSSIGLEDGEVEIEKRLKDLYLYQTFSSSYTNDIGDRGGHLLNASLVAYNQYYTKHRDYNIQYLALSLAPTFQSRSAQFSLPLTYEYIRYNDEHLLDSYSLAPRFSYALSSDSFVNLYLKYQRRSFENSSSKDTHLKEIGFGWNRDYGSYSILLETYAQKEDKRASSEDKFIEKRANGVKLGYSRNILSFADLGVMYRYKVTNFYDTLENSQYREDKQSNYDLSLSKEVYKDLSAILSYGYQKNSSNYKILDYDKHSYGVAMTYSF